jgi:hypothetical protein
LPSFDSRYADTSWVIPEKAEIRGFRTLLDPIGAQGALVDVVRSPMVVGAGFPEMLLQEGLRLRPEIEPGCDGRARPSSPNPRSHSGTFIR